MSPSVASRSNNKLLDRKKSGTKRKLERGRDLGRWIFGGRPVGVPGRNCSVRFLAPNARGLGFERLEERALLTAGFQVLHSFSGAPTDGGVPYCCLTLVGSTLFGTTACGSSTNEGTVFSINTDGAGFQVLHSFSGGPTDGASPEAALTLVGSTLFGTTANGGISNDDGTVFSIETDGADFQVLHSFSGEPADGASPKASLTLVGSTLFGTTAYGGSYTETNNGTVFSINTDGTDYKVLDSFSGEADDGGVPEAGLTLVGSNLVGTTCGGGSSADGTVFSINTDGTVVRILHLFSGEPADGRYPSASLTLVGSTLFGTTASGGSPSEEGTVFAISALVPDAAPTVTSLSPSEGASAGGTAVTITGSGFAGTTVVYFGSNTASFTVVSDTEIKATTPIGSGVVDVKVTTPDGTSATSAADQFTYPGAPSTVGLYDPTNSMFMLRNANDSGFADECCCYGAGGSGMLPIVGDWTGDGVDTVGLYDPSTSTFYLSNTNAGGYANNVFVFGPANGGDVPLVGDWNGGGKDTVGLYNPTTGMFFLKNTDSSGFADAAFIYGPANSGDIPLVGDWNGNGKDTISLYNSTTSTFYERNSNSTGFADTTFAFGPAKSGWKPLMGDWAGSGKDTAGLYNPATSMFYLRNSNTTGFANMTFMYGPANAGCVPLAGNWTGFTQAEMAASQGADAALPTLAESDLQPIINEAITLWSQAGLNAAAIQKLRQAQFVVTALPGSYLGETEGNVIYLDGNAAGNGWFVDPTPASNAEFSAQAGSSQLKAVAPHAVDHIDLLTVVEHELGHIVGLADNDALPDDIMDGVLGVGMRRIASHADAVLASV